MITVLIADDQELIRIGLRTLVDGEDDLDCVGEAADGLAVVALAARTRPDIVLMDIRMPGIDGLEATRRITADLALAATRIIVLTTFERDEYIFDALRHGASGFLLKDSKPAELLRALRTVADGGALMSPSVTRTLVREFVTLRPHVRVPHPQLSTLTDRERETVVLAANGLSNDEIGDRLRISSATARTHISRAMLKLGARDRAQLVVFVYRSGLMD
ncbi:response regulator transcription factor [Actinoplanes derwentensis]|uniref:DNA-binding response regulator, NarL/FixJ family, contains REC and HTH domains n=1 Tax=Actinoplanes derwentensis TaxID=113562 RepID=A0A1H2D7D3_9ACTN|nr:response regulator transcription factor [Actinoplanes derwentensis]GID85631.1 DNA-binding response regulator [Actinoplanes derwentensis]SDT78166.1 DNA-binding response regulator, NarL/FixJ family, contains REC and HTH domains [Actinoplanes derwentensis]